MLGQPVFHQPLRVRRQVTLGHLHRGNVKDTDRFTLHGVNVRRIVFLRLEEHLNHDSVEPRNYRHGFSFLRLLLYHNSRTPQRPPLPDNRRRDIHPHGTMSSGSKTDIR